LGKPRIRKKDATPRGGGGNGSATTTKTKKSLKKSQAKKKTTEGRQKRGKRDGKERFYRLRTQASKKTKKCVRSEITIIQNRKKKVIRQVPPPSGTKKSRPARFARPPARRRKNKQALIGTVLGELSNQKKGETRSGKTVWCTGKTQPPTPKPQKTPALSLEGNTPKKRWATTIAQWTEVRCSLKQNTNKGRVGGGEKRAWGREGGVGGKKKQKEPRKG